MASKVQLVGVVSNIDGTPVSDGRLEIYPAADAVIAGVCQIAGRIGIEFGLDSNGSPVNAYLWPTDQMQSGVAPQYNVTAYDAEGQPVFGPRSVTLPSGTTFDVSNWIGN